MTPKQFTDALNAIGWSRRHLVSLLRCDPTLATRWGTGSAPIPPSIGKWLVKLAACHEQFPPPDDWRVR